MKVCCCYLKLTLYKVYSSLIATCSINSYAPIKAIVHSIQPTCVWVVRLFRSLNTMYSLILATIIWMIYGVSFAVSHSAASWRHMVEMLLFGSAFRQGRSVIKYSVFCWLPLNVCQQFFILYCVAFQLQAIKRVSIVLFMCPHPIGRGSDGGSEEGGECSGPGLPVTSFDKHWWRSAQHWNHPILFESE